MALLCLVTNTPWPWPTPAGAASARGGFPTLGTERERSGGGVAEWRGRSAAEVCTSEARKIRVPLAHARDGVPQEGLVSLFCAERRKMLCFSGGRCGRERPAEEGAGRRWLHSRLQAGRSVPPFPVMALVLCLSGVLRNEG